MIHVRTWSGSGSVRITDMTNAHKRGKQCRVFRFSGWLPFGGDAAAQAAHQLTLEVQAWAKSLPESTSYDDALAECRRMVESPPLPGISINEDMIKAINAPRRVLSAGDGKTWSASADDEGITLDDLADQCNLPCMITPHNQTKHQAYTLAAKVWDKVQRAASFHDAGNVLMAAGCRLHYFCRMD